MASCPVRVSSEDIERLEKWTGLPPEAPFSRKLHVFLDHLEGGGDFPLLRRVVREEVEKVLGVR